MKFEQPARMEGQSGKRKSPKQIVDDLSKAEERVNSKAQLADARKQLSYEKRIEPVRSHWEKQQRPPFQERDLFPGLEKPTGAQLELKALEKKINELQKRISRLEDHAT